MKKVFLFLVCFLFVGKVYGADLTVSFNIPEAKVDEYIEHYTYVHKNTELNDPADPESGLKYTDKAWVKEHIIRQVRGQIIRGRNAKYRDDMTNYSVDDIN